MKVSTEHPYGEMAGTNITGTTTFGSMLKQLFMWYFTTVEGTMILVALLLFFAIGKIVSDSLEVDKNNA